LEWADQAVGKDFCGVSRVFFAIPLDGTLLTGM